MSKLKTHYEQVPLASLKFFKSGVQQEEMPGDPRQDSGKKDRAGAAVETKDEVEIHDAHI